MSALTTFRSGVHRSRWAAIGAAVAVSLGAGTLAVTHAASSPSTPSNFVAITPCRLADTRPSVNVGAFDTPIGPDESRDLTVHGTNGECTIPDTATAVAVNVTALDATVKTFFTMHPADQPLPTAANLNPAPGEPPTPNFANVTLATDGDGDFSLYNSLGTVDYVIDIAGYYLPAASAPFAVEAVSSEPLQPQATFGQQAVAAVSVEVPTPSAGTIVASSSVSINDRDNDETTECALSLSEGSIEPPYGQRWQSSGNLAGRYGTIANDRVFEVDASADSVTVYLNCAVGGNLASETDGINPVITAIFLPSGG